MDSLCQLYSKSYQELSFAQTILDGICSYELIEYCNPHHPALLQKIYRAERRAMNKKHQKMVLNLCFLELFIPDFPFEAASIFERLFKLHTNINCNQLDVGL